VTSKAGRAREQFLDLQLTSGMMSAAVQAAARLQAAPPAVDTSTRSMRVPQLLTRAPEAVLQQV